MFLNNIIPLDIFLSTSQVDCWPFYILPFTLLLRSPVNSFHWLTVFQIHFKFSDFSSCFVFIFLLLQIFWQTFCQLIFSFIHLSMMNAVIIKEIVVLDKITYKMSSLEKIPTCKHSSSCMRSLRGGSCEQRSAGHAGMGWLWKMKQHPLLWGCCLLVLRAFTVLLSAEGIIAPLFIFHVQIVTSNINQS